MDAGGRATQGAVAENSYLTTDAVSEDPMNQLLGHSITYRIALGPQVGRKVFTLQHCRPVNPMITLIQQTKYPDSPCMRAWRPGLMSARN